MHASPLPTCYYAKLIAIGQTVYTSVRIAYKIRRKMGPSRPAFQGQSGLSELTRTIEISINRLETSAENIEFSIAVIYRGFTLYRWMRWAQKLD